ncbi:MAG: class I SAM-dependent methyltransferase [Verrucomicrobia bacterium]|nr:class I SAM-dependent methyltransferase [Verrucomicrobiota bacterium]
MNLPLILKIKAYLFREQIRVVRRYYRGRFVWVDLALLLAYLFSNPYRMCRKFLQKRGARNIYAYGETPLTTLEKIAKAFDIRSDDRWLELGSGRGRACFWMAHHWGCQARGVEWIPAFASRAKWIGKFFGKADFLAGSMEEADFSWPTVVFLYGTGLSDQELDRLLEPMRGLPKGTKVITISEPLEEYRQIRSIPVSFPWGETDAYLQVKG